MLVNASPPHDVQGAAPVALKNEGRQMQEPLPSGLEPGGHLERQVPSTHRPRSH
jgi:hypothetical protein